MRKIFANLYSAASEKRIKRAFSCLLRGDFQFLWHQLKRFSSNQQDGMELRKPILEVLNTLGDYAVKPPLLKERIDLIIPVYNGYEYLEPLFESIKLNTISQYRLIVIDDASPDVRVWPLLNELISFAPESILVRNEKNLGFVKTVNKAASYVEGDFALLNTDIEVPEYWLERLMMPIVTDRKVASTTPFSNAATILSFPEMNVDNSLPYEVAAGQIDSCFLQLRADLPQVPVPTGVGFCMGVNGAVWEQIGGFDDVLFHRGYGEENDWCQRAISSGFCNLAVQNLFVYHKHGGSFEVETRSALREDNYRKLLSRWPGYSMEVAKFIAADPLAFAREMATLLAICNEGPISPVLVIDHNIGGGANVYRRKLIEERLVNNQPVFLLTAPQNFGALKEKMLLDFYFSKYIYRYEINSYDELYVLFEAVRLGEIFYNNLVSYQDPLSVVRLLIDLKLKTKARLVVAVHDFFPLSPSYTLLNSSGVYSGICGINNTWLGVAENPFSYNPRKNSEQEWREVWGGLLSCADEIICFSDNSRRHMEEAYPSNTAQLLVRPHTLPVQFRRIPKLLSEGPLHIVVIGSISISKGAAIIAELSKILAREDPQAQITILGILEGAPHHSNVSVRGAYQVNDLPTLIEDCGANVCLLPSIWPETFSYVAEEVMALNMPLVCFDLGAPAERVLNYPRGQIASDMSASAALEAIRLLRSRLSV